MTRYGAQYGPDVTFLGIDSCNLDEPASYADADVVIVGAPFDGGTSHRPGTRFGPQAIRITDYLPHDGSRPSLALRTDGLRDLRVVDAGDVEMYSGDIQTALPRLEAAVQAVAAAGAIPVVLGVTTRSRTPTRRESRTCSATAGCRSFTSTPTPTPAISSLVRCGDTGSRCGA